MNTKHIALGASISLALVGITLVLASIAAIVGAAWAVLGGGVACLYAAYVLSTIADDEPLTVVATARNDKAADE